MATEESGSPFLRVELTFSPVRLWGLAVGALLSGILVSLLLSRLAGEERSLTVLVATSAVWVVATMLVFTAALELLSRRGRRAERLNRELLALHQAALAVHGEQKLDDRLERIVEEARQLVDARYGALSVLDEHGKILSFIVSGISAEERARVGDPPRGHGLLGVPLHEGQVIRIKDLTHDARRAGFPDGHPIMHSLLAVPVTGSERFKGNLYVTEKRGGEGFTTEDQDTLTRFATTAALAVDNAYLNRGLRSLAIAEERMRIAREMHDGMAQVLAYVNTKALAVNEFLAVGNTGEARQQLDQLAAAAREIYTDAREGILSLRAAGDTDQDLAESLRGYVTTWSEMAGIEARLEIDGDVRVETHRELQLVRIVQEALANVRKHSSAKLAIVRLARVGADICLDIVDNGVGFDEGRPRVGEQPRFGLATMRERAEDAGGTLEVLARPGQGTSVRARLPTGAREPSGPTRPSRPRPNKEGDSKHAHPDR